MTTTTQTTPATTQATALSVITCVEMVSQAALDRRSAINNELAVGLGMFYEAGGTTQEAKSALQEVYHRSGYECQNSSGADYVTINRRLNASAKLYDFLGAEQIGNWVGNKVERQLVSAIIEGLKPSNLYSIDKVMAFIGKPRAKAGPAEAEGSDEKDEHPQGGATDTPTEQRPQVYRLATQHMKLEVPKDGEVHPQELMDMAAKLITLAQKIQKEENKKATEADPVTEAETEAVV